MRDRLKNYIKSIPGEKRIDHAYFMKVKGKCQNAFLGIMKLDLPHLAIEGFPEVVNSQIKSLMLFPRYDLIWFDINITDRSATMKANFFVG
jgi:hypothetical protein